MSGQDCEGSIILSHALANYIISYYVELDRTLERFSDQKIFIFLRIFHALIKTKTLFCEAGFK